MSVDFSKLQIVVSNFVKNQEFTYVVLNVSYIDETANFDVSIATDQTKKTDFYVRQAFKLLKKDIKKWVRKVSDKPSIIGSIVSVNPQDFDEEDIAD